MTTNQQLLRHTKMAKYRLYSYDVWGNTREGFWVNDIYRTATVIEINPEYSDYRINRILSGKGIVYDWHEFVIYANLKRNGKPLFELRPEE